MVCYVWYALSVTYKLIKINGDNYSNKYVMVMNKV